MKKIVKLTVSALSLCLALSLCIGLVGCKKPCDTHEWNLVSTTATCTENGTENYACKICGFLVYCV